MEFHKRKVDKYLLIPVFVLSFWSLFHLYTIAMDGTYYYFQRQLIWVGCGSILLFLFYFLPTYIWPKLAYAVYGAAALFLVVVILKTESIHGAKRWLEVGSVGFQPSEFAKIALIILLGKLLANRQEVQWKTVTLSFLLTMFLFFLIAIQPDLGTALIVFSIWLIILFVSGISLRKLLVLMGAIIASFPVSYTFLRPYQKMRILTFLQSQKDPLGAGWSSLQSKIALGSGRLLGKGIGGAAHTKLKYLSQPFTDFIFSSMGEEWGFVGIAFIITTYIVIITRGTYLALKKGNSFSGLFASGFTALVAIQAFVNMGTASGIIPVTGVSLPFISYGGSATLLFLSGTGILLAISREAE